MRWVGPAIGVRRDLHIEHVNIAVGKQVAEMIVGPPVAKTQFQDMARRVGQRLGGGVQHAALRLEAIDDGVESGQ